MEQVAGFKLGGRESKYIVKIIPAENSPKSSLKDGPVPGRFIHLDENDEYLGEILIWIENGYISALEYAWITDSLPLSWPCVKNIKLSK